MRLDEIWLHFRRKDYFGKYKYTTSYFAHDGNIYTFLQLVTIFCNFASDGFP